MIDKPKKTHRQVQKEDTRRIILDSAYALFAEKGYEKTTMRTLAESAGVGLGTIFKHFPDKPSLLAAAFQDDFSVVIQNAFQSLPEAGFKCQLLHITRSIYSFYAEKPEFSRTLIKEVLFLDGGYGDLLDAQIMVFLDKISGLLNRAKKNGELHPDMDCESGSLAFWSFYFMVLLMGLKQQTFDIDQHLDTMEILIDNHFS